MKTNYNYRFIFALICFFGLHQLKAQEVAIGNTAPHESALLHVDNGQGDKGLLIPNVDIVDVNTPAPVAAADIVESLLVFNTNTTTGIGFYYWTGTSWSRWETNKDYLPSVKYTSNNTSQNFNTTSYQAVRMFENLQYNDDTDFFTYINNTTIQINKTGRYLVNSYVSYNLGDDVGVMTTFRVNNTTFIGSKYICRTVNNPNTQMGVAIREAFTLNAGDLFQVVSRRTYTTLNPSASARLYNQGNSFFEITFIKRQ